MVKKISINLPSLAEQREAVFEAETAQAILMLKSNLNGQPYPKTAGVDYDNLDPRIFLTQEQGWIVPPPALIDAWFSQVKTLFSEYGSDAKLGNLLGLQGSSADRRVRAYRNGSEAVPYGIWRRFLEITGRVAVDVRPVLGLFDRNHD